MKILMVVRAILLILGISTLVFSLAGALIISNGSKHYTNKFAKKLHKTLFFSGTSLIIISAILYALI